MPDDKAEFERQQELKFLRENFRIRARGWGVPEWRIDEIIEEAERERIRSGSSLN